MATYDNLPVYKDSYDLLLGIFIFSKAMAREYKYTVGENLKTETVNLIANIYRANCSFNKTNLIRAARENIEVVRLYLRLIKDLKQISLPQFIKLNELIESISKQLSWWQKTIINQGQSRHSVTAMTSAPN
ncbi:MAG: four helix bundle protein [Candidatus Falkowbacteria bacterium]|nr:four helix bundle protein [Candidatus Falkowbacteria bacterium]